MTATIDEYRAKLKAMLPELAERYGVAELGLFGSRVRGDHREDSDLDVLVTFKPDAKLSLFDEGGMVSDLEDRLNVKIDLAMKKYLKPILRPYILSEAIKI